MSGDRARAMAARLAGTAERRGIGPSGIAAIAAAFDAAMMPRRGAGLDERHPDFLHPARTALILMDDAGVSDPDVVSAALLTETRDPALRPDPGAVAAAGGAVEALVRAVPETADSGAVLEALVVARDPVLLIALAERLDHARHLHLRPPAEWEPYHRLTCTAYAPAAARAHRRLERRLTWWCGTFRKRFLHHQ